jgi:hypothetical protein
MTEMMLCRYNGSSIPTQNQGGFLFGNLCNLLGCDEPLTSVQVDAYTEMGSASSDMAEAATAAKYGTNHISVTADEQVTLVLRDGICWLPPDYPDGLTFSAQMWLRRSGGASVGTHIGFRFYDIDNSSLGEEWGPVTVTSTSYQSYALDDIAVPSGTVRFELLIGWPATSSGSLYIDGIAVVAGSLPAEEDVVIPGFGFGLGPFETPGVSWYLIQRKLPGGEWATIAAPRTDRSADVTLTDYVFPEGMTFTYRACVLAAMNGQLVQGAWSSEETVNAASPNEQWAIWDPSKEINGGGPLRFDLDGSRPELTTRWISATSMYSPIASDRRVVTKDTSKGKSFILKMDVVAAADIDVWDELHQDRNGLIMTRPSTGEAWSVILESDFTVRTHNTTPASYTVEVRAEEIDVPSVWA